MPTTIKDIRASLIRRETTVLDLVETSVVAAHTDADDLGAFVAVADDRALAEARNADKCILELGEEAWAKQPLLGVTFSVKDLIQTAELPTRRGSLLDNPRPEADAPSVAALRRAGAIVIGKTTTSEHGWSASTVNRVSPPTRNPWNPGRSTGGSSGGAAAAVATGMGVAALGTDGAGSVRIPASFCGVVGFKPTFGRVPYHPPCADRLAHVGPLANSVDDIAELMNVLSRPHLKDPDSGSRSTEPPQDASQLRVGWVDLPGAEPDVLRVCQRARTYLEGGRHRLEHLDETIPDPYPDLVTILAATEAVGMSENEEELADPGRIAIAEYGRSLSGADVMRAEEARMDLRVKMRSVMDRFDLLVMPTVPIEPFAVDAIAPPWAADPEEQLWLAWSPATYPFNMTGQPALTVPMGLTGYGLPVGLQIVGPYGQDDLVLAFAREIELERGDLPRVPLNQKRC